MDYKIKPCTVILDRMEPCTPKPQTGLSADLRNTIAEKNMLTTRTRKKFLSDLDEINAKNVESERTVFRDKAIDEILTSEISYLNQLKIVQNYFMKPIKERGILNQDEFHTLFGNISTIFNVNSELLYELNKNPKNVASAFSKLAPFFKLYSVYAYDYKNALNILQTAPERNLEFAKFLELQESRPEVQKKLSALLIAPIQRVPRYCLLLQQVLHHTSPRHSSYSLIIESLRQVEKAAKHINNLVEDQENTQKLLELQRSLLHGFPSIIKPDRKLIKEGVLMKMSQKGNQSYKRYFVLMSDVLMYCKLKKDNPHSVNALKCSCILPLNKCTITDMQSKGAFKIKCEDETIVVHHHQADECREWIKAFQDAISKYVNNRRTLRKDSSSRRPAHKKLLDTYQDPGISPGIPRKKRQLNDYEDAVFKNILNDSDDSDCGVRNCFPHKAEKRKPIHKDNFLELASSRKLPKIDERDSLFPLRQQLFKEDMFYGSLDNIANSPLSHNTSSNSNQKAQDVFVFGKNNSEPQGFRFRMNNILAGVGNSFKRWFGLKEN